MESRELKLTDDRDAFGDKLILWSGTTGWFYIEAGNNPEKCLYASETGHYYYGAKELSRIIPVVWNSRVSAGRVARIHRGRVKKYPYRLG